MTKIANFDQYNASMAKQIIDKLFFLPMAVGADTIVDFGCADGTLLKRVHDFDPSLKLIGYDNNIDMCKAAQKDCDYVKFFSSFDDAMKGVNIKGSLINLSSVIHEVYSYSSATEIDDFWKKVFYSDFEYISIRDMMFSDTSIRPTPMRDEMKVRCVMRDLGKDNLISDFEKIHGPISVYKNFLHFLLKYKYEKNWDREVHENYFPISTNDFFAKMPSDYEIVYYDRYILPYLYDRVEQDFGVGISDNTHIKILLRKKTIK